MSPAVNHERSKTVSACTPRAPIAISFKNL